MSLLLASGTNAYAYTGNGGITFGGASTYKEGWKYPDTGGISFGGAATQKEGWKYTVSGGLIFAGAGALKEGWKYSVSGGIVFSGAAATKEGWIPAVSNGVLFGGAASTAYTPVSQVNYPYTGTGGIVFGGVGQSAYHSSQKADSRGTFTRRLHAQATVEGYLNEFLPITKSSVSADAQAAVAGVQVNLEIGVVGSYTDVSLATQVTVQGIQDRVSVGVVSIQADSSATVIPELTAAAVGSVRVVSDAEVFVRGVHHVVVIGQIGAEIGPDLVVQEDEEFLFVLMEAA